MHSRGTREAIRAVISRREGKQAMKSKEGAIKCCKENKIFFPNTNERHFFQKLWPLLYTRAELDLRLTNVIVGSVMSISIN